MLLGGNFASSLAELLTEVFPLTAHRTPLRGKEKIAGEFRRFLPVKTWKVFC